MIYTVVTPGGQILLDKGSATEFDAWMNENRFHVISQCKRRHAIRSDSAPDELYCVVVLYRGRRRR